MTHRFDLLTGCLGLLLLLSRGDPTGAGKSESVDPPERADVHTRPGFQVAGCGEARHSPVQDISSDSYRTIVERNVFGLEPAPPPAAPPVSMPPPKEDLFLAGLMGGPNSGGCASFMMTTPGQPPRYFTVTEGDQNDWLEVLSVDTESGAVKVRLKKPVVRIQNVGAEVLISFKTFGIKTP